MKQEWKFTDYDLEYLGRGDDQVAALARELLSHRRMLDALRDVNAMYPSIFS